MKWLKEKVSLKIAAILALLPAVSWSSSCASDDYGCPDVHVRSDKDCCQLLYENEVYARMCQESVAYSKYELYNTHCGHSCADEYRFKLECAIKECGELKNDNSNRDEWLSCVDTSIKDEAKCKTPWALEK